MGKGTIKLSYERRFKRSDKAELSKIALANVARGMVGHTAPNVVLHFLRSTSIYDSGVRDIARTEQPAPSRATGRSSATSQSGKTDSSYHSQSRDLPQSLLKMGRSRFKEGHRYGVRHRPRGLHSTSTTQRHLLEMGVFGVLPVGLFYGILGFVFFEFTGERLLEIELIHLRKP
jgi:hypothetical protein